MALLSNHLALSLNIQPQQPKHSPIDMNNVTTIILGGGQGTRLAPLTDLRCKPAMPIGGKFLLIDIPISNAIHAGIPRIFVITQYMSHVLHQHIFRTYRPGTYSQGFVEILTAEQGPERSWFNGTADAIRQNVNYLQDIPGDYFLILSGDQLYRMNFTHMMKFAKEINADLVVASQPVDEANARRMGLLKLNEDRFITEFYEKPQERAVLDHMKMPEYVIKQIADEAKSDQVYLGSMGIYLFKREALLDLLKQDPREDFGKHLIPTKVSQGNVAAYVHNGYWEDIGTIGSFYQANIALTTPDSPFNCYDVQAPIFSQHHHLPPSRVVNTQLNNAIISDGSVIEAKAISNSIIGMRSCIKADTQIDRSYIIGNDYHAHSPISLHIGAHCQIENAIIDRNVHIGNNVKLINKNRLTHYNGDHIYIRDGIIIVGSGAVLPDGFTL